MRSCLLSLYHKRDNSIECPSIVLETGTIRKACLTSFRWFDKIKCSEVFRQSWECSECFGSSPAIVESPRVNFRLFLEDTGDSPERAGGFSDTVLQNIYIYIYISIICGFLVIQIWFWDSQNYVKNWWQCNPCTSSPSFAFATSCCVPCDISINLVSCDSSYRTSRNYT